jgi:hypothetical protein
VIRIEAASPDELDRRGREARLAARSQENRPVGGAAQTLAQQKETVNHLALERRPLHHVIHLRRRPT